MCRVVGVDGGGDHLSIMLRQHLGIRRIEIDLMSSEEDADITYYFIGQTEPYSIREFTVGSRMRVWLEQFETALRASINNDYPEV
jgi:hypothetical protein